MRLTGGIFLGQSEKKLSDEALRLALLAAGMLEDCLLSGSVRSARDCAGMMKDMAAVAECDGQTASSIRVSIDGG